MYGVRVRDSIASWLRQLENIVVTIYLPNRNIIFYQTHTTHTQNGNVAAGAALESFSNKVHFENIRVNFIRMHWHYSDDHSTNKLASWVFNSKHTFAIQFQ